MKAITIQLSDKDARNFKWILGLRYGSRKSLETLVKLSVMEIIALQASQIADDALGREQLYARLDTVSKEE